MSMVYQEDIKAEARRWVVRLASGNLSETEWTRLQTWLAQGETTRGAFELERRLWQDLGAIEDAFGARDDSAQRRHNLGLVLRPAYGWAAAAACVMALVFGPQVWVQMQTDYAAPQGQVEVVTLPDGSEMALDSDSRVAVDFDAGRRAVKVLQGRAWFEVRHGDTRPFTVAAKGGLTEDIGTAFEVDAAGSAVAVRVSGGAVRVRSHEGGGWADLTAGQGISYDSRKARSLNDMPVEDIAVWRRGEIILRDTDINQAVDEIARYRRAPVMVVGQLDQIAPVSGNFRTDAPEAALETLADMRALKITRLPGGIWLVSK